MVGSVSLKMANKNKINQKNSALCTLDKNDRVQTYDFISSFMSCNIWRAEIGFFLVHNFHCYNPFRVHICTCKIHKKS